MNLPSTPPVPLTEKCVECGGDLPEGGIIRPCGYCLGSLCPKGEPGHNERLRHPEYPPTA
jgi:uncharacterized UBP type Zn finger protein